MPSPLFQGYASEGYLHLKCDDYDFRDIVNNASSYYTQVICSGSARLDKAFRDKDGVARHLVDVANQSFSPARSIIDHPFLKRSLLGLLDSSKRYVLTHSKISYKTPGASGVWLPHQDAGYSKVQKTAFTVFVCLEHMSASNGCLCVYPGSHKLGLLPHAYVKENSLWGNGQMNITNPEFLSKMKTKLIEACAGDIVVFDQLTIHRSDNSLSDSLRPALIFGIQELCGPVVLDSHYKLPVIFQGNYSKLEITSSKFFQLLNSPIAALKRMSSQSILFRNILLLVRDFIRRAKVLVRK